MRNALMRLFIVLWITLGVGAFVIAALQLSNDLFPSKELVLAKAREISDREVVSTPASVELNASQPKYKYTVEDEPKKPSHIYLVDEPKNPIKANVYEQFVEPQTASNPDVVVATMPPRCQLVETLANWIVENKEMKGTSEFDAIGSAYTKLKDACQLTENDATNNQPENHGKYVEVDLPHDKYVLLDDSPAVDDKENMKILSQFEGEATNALRLEAFKNVIFNVGGVSFVLAAILLALQFVLLGVANPLKLKVRQD